ncbi:DMT family transporter [Arenimonas fontis]|uniref:DMT family transporter n=1 Tax=Arenimonas fontis TaxID=2608255 RepID=A0A5B2Z7W1_9GAMM|nr:DMT family transporter [Arenimonas fontis]KAA2283965.1 DMT family transporter [Arenimonas fontis]
MESSRNLRGIVAMLLAVGCFSLMDGGLKHLAGHYPPLQVAALRGLSALPLVSLWVLASGRFHTLWRVRWGLHLLRAGLSIGMLAAFAYAIHRMPLTSAYALFFVAPLLITALSVPLLGEKVGLRRWAAIGAGLAGVLVALRPGGEGVASLAGLAVLAAAAGYALSAIMVRILHRTDSSHSLVFWMIAMTALFASLLSLPGWVPLRGDDAWVLAGVGLTGFLGQVAITEAFRSGEASVVAPFEYSALAWGLGLDLVVWNTLPDGWTFAGAGIVIASGLYLIHRERVVSTDSRAIP